jgi:hypothetical protein
MPDSDLFNGVESRNKSRQYQDNLSKLVQRGSDGQLECQKSGQLFIRVHNETLSFAVGVNNKDVSPLGINS